MGYTSCPECSRSWSAPNACHCMGCHRHFASLSGFDAHQSSTGCLRLDDARWKLFESARPGGVVWVTSLGGYQPAAV